jgi:hypothetical protein
MASVRRDRAVTDCLPNGDAVLERDSALPRDEPRGRRHWHLLESPSNSQETMAVILKPENADSRGRREASLHRVEPRAGIPEFQEADAQAREPPQAIWE